MPRLSSIWPTCHVSVAEGMSIGCVVVQSAAAALTFRKNSSPKSLVLSRLHYYHLQTFHVNKQLPRRYNEHISLCDKTVLHTTMAEDTTTFSVSTTTHPRSTVLPIPYDWRFDDYAATSYQPYTSARGCQWDSIMKHSLRDSRPRYNHS